MRQRFWIVLLAGLVTGHAAAAADKGECPEMDPSARVRVETPGMLAARVRALAEAVGPSSRAAELQRQLEAAGCTEVQRQGDPKLRVPNLVCTLLGRSRDVIVVGSSLEHDGMAAAALLPALVEVLRRDPREHTYQVVAFGRGHDGAALGARHFARSLPTDRPPALVVHLGFIGFGPPRIEPKAHEIESCRLMSVADRMDIELGTVLFEEARAPSADCSYFGALDCLVTPSEGIADRQAFLVRGIPFVGLTARAGKRASLDPVAHYSAYQLLAVYLTVADRALAPAASASP